MLYKNKNIRSNYSVMFIVFIVGAVLTGVALLAAIYGAITAAKNVKDVQHIDTVMKASGNHAGHAVYFDITEAPVFLSKDKKSYYYLLTDGNEYRVADLDDEEYEEIKSAVEETGSYHIQGLTYYIVGSDKRSRVASRAGKLIGQNVTEKNMNDILGDVCIDQMKISFWNMFKGGFGMVGIIVGLIGVFIFWGSSGELRTSRKVISLSNITARDIDEEACKADSVWLDSLKIYLTENMVLGIISDGKKHEGQVALKYREIQRIYGHNSTKGTERSYIVESIAIDGNKYILADSKYGMYSDDMKSELKELYRWVKDKNPNALYEPGNIKYKTYRFSYVLNDEEAYDGTIDEDEKEEIIQSFDQANCEYSFKASDAIVSMKMSFPEDGIVEITTGYFEDRENDVIPELYDFIKDQLLSGWGEGCEYPDCIITFKEMDVKNKKSL